MVTRSLDKFMFQIALEVDFATGGLLDLAGFFTQNAAAPVGNHSDVALATSSGDKTPASFLILGAFGYYLGGVCAAPAAPPAPPGPHG